jgi:hypothetical protein
MSLFTLGNVETKTQHGPHPEGKHVGKVVEVEVKKSQAGHEYLFTKIKTDAGQITNSLHLLHPNAKESAMRTLSEMLSHGYGNPPKTLESMADIAIALTALPVCITVKHKGENDKGYMQYGIYFNALPEGTAKAEYGASALPF